jgi:hypothetical protein
MGENPDIRHGEKRGGRVGGPLESDSVSAESYEQPVLVPQSRHV